MSQAPDCMVKTFVAFLFLSCVALAWASHDCPGRTSGQTHRVEIPTPPDSLDGTARIAWMAGHYWDSVDLRDTLWLTDTASLEQSFATWSWMLQHVPAQDASRMVSGFVSGLAEDRGMLYKVMSMAESYYDDPNSPYRAEELWISALEAFLAVPGLPQERIIRPEWQLKSAMKNRPGTTAADISGYLPNGGRAGLSDFRGKTVILLFYEPGCPECARTERYIRQSPVLGPAIITGRIKVLAVYPGDDRGLWEEHLPEFPSSWTVVMSPDVYSRLDYVVRATPTLYLIDRSGTVLLKDVSAETLEAYLR